MKQFILGAISGLFVLSMLVGIAVLGALLWFEAPGPDRPLEPLIIEPGTSSAKISQQLEEAGYIEYGWLFRAVTTLKGMHREFRAGEYAYKPGMSPQAIAEMLIKGQAVTHAITIPEGKTSREIAAILKEDSRLTGSVPMPLAEGSLLPDTHHVHRGDSRASVIRRMREAQDQFLQGAWADRAPSLPFSTPQEALILASIVEKETGLHAEREKVAAVFINRLRRGMKLQSDPTVVYAIELESGPMERPLTRKDWQLTHPYNTYHITGLPPGPICHPGKAAIHAVLHPAQTNALYFVATGMGGHYFADNLREHNRNVQRYKRNMQAAP